MTSRRDSYAEVGEATRGAIDAALAAPELRPATWRVLLAIIRELSTWSRLDDAVARPHLAEIAGLSERQVTRHLSALAAAGVVTWRPGSRGRSSRLSIRHHCGTSPCLAESDGAATNSETAPCPATDGRLRDIPKPIAGHPGANSEAPPCPTPEKASEEGPEEGTAAAIARRLTPDRHHHELPTLIAELDTRHNPARVLDTLTELDRNGARYAYPSRLRRAVDEHLAANSTASPLPPWCGTCEGDRNRTRPVDETAGEYQLCPECNPKAMAAS